MRSYDILVKEIHDSAYRDLLNHTRNTETVLHTALAELPELSERGGLTAAVVEHFDLLLQQPGPPPLDVREYVSEFNLVGAQTLGLLDLIRQTALTRCRILLAIAQQLDPRQQQHALQRITTLALNLAKQWNLQEFDANLVGDLHLQAGNIYMGNVGPLTSDVDQGLQHFVDGYRLKREKAPQDEIARLASLMREAAGFLLAQAQLGYAFNTDVSRTHQKLQAAVEVFELVGPAEVLVEARMQLLQFYLTHRFLQAAEPLLQRLLDGHALPPDKLLIVSLHKADWLSQKHQPAEALAILEPLFEANRISAANWLYAQTIRANCYRLLDRFDRAYEAFIEILQRSNAAIAQQPSLVQPRHRRFLAQVHLGYLDIRRGRLKEGQAWFEEAITSLESHLLTHDLRLRHADLWAMALYEVGAWTAALEKYEEARGLRQQIETESKDPSLREGLMGNWALVDARIIELTIGLGKLRRSLEVGEGSKARNLQELARWHTPLGVLGGRPLQPDGHQEPSRFTPERMLLHDFEVLASTKRRLAHEAATLPPTSPTRTAVEHRLLSLDRQSAGLREIIEANAAKRVFRPPIAPVAPLTVEDVLTLLPEDRASWGLVSFYSGGQGTAALVAAPGEPISLAGLWQKDWPYERLLEEIYQPWDGVRHAYFSGQAQLDDWLVALDRCRRQLFAVLWAPIAPTIKHMGLRHLLILPHRLLHLLPYAGLQDEATGQDLLDTVASISVAPGAGLLRRVAAELSPSRECGKATIFAVPDMQAALMALEAIQLAAQCRELQGARVTPNIGAESHPEALYQAGLEAGWLHLACHGVWNAEDLAGSGLHMAPLPEGMPPLFGQADGLVNLPALLTQLYLPKCELAVLSACESGLAKRSAADEPLSLPLAFLLAGARQVVASLWRVRDDSTLLLMREFYRRYLCGEMPAESLAGAQRWLRTLSPVEAIALLEMNAQEIEALPLPQPLIKRIQVQLTRLRKQLSAMPPGERPYASPDHWGAFVCFGLPSAKLRVEP